MFFHLSAAVLFEIKHVFVANVLDVRLLLKGDSVLFSGFSNVMFSDWTGGGGGEEQ